MKRIMKSYIFAALLSIVSMVIIANLYYTGDPGKFFLLANKLEIKSDNITDVDVEFIDQKVYLNVRLKTPSTCKRVMKDLGINTIVVGSSSYSPTCAVINGTLIRITYTEITNI